MRYRERNRPWWEHPFTTALQLVERPIEEMQRPLRQMLSTDYPVIDLDETEKEVIVTAEVPGMSSSDLSICYREGVLTIQGELKERVRHKARYARGTNHSFVREIPLGQNLEWDLAKASCKDGLLTITIPRKEGVRELVKEIEID
jgi:HSP20 family protein